MFSNLLRAFRSDSLRTLPKKGRYFYNFPFATPSGVEPVAERPLISVILPVYNQAAYLRESISSVLTQTGYPLELILINDGSTDNIQEALRPFADDPRLRVYEQKNCGLAHALNRGFELAQGTFLTWTSADNCFLPGALKKLGDFLLLNPGIALVYANVRLIDKKGAELKNSSYRELDQDPNSSDLLLLPLTPSSLPFFHDNFINACFLYRRELRDGVGTYNESFRGYEDFDYWVRGSKAFCYAHLDDDAPFYKYRLHPNSLTETLEKDSLAEEVKAYIENKKQQTSLGKKDLSCTIQTLNEEDAATSYISKTLNTLGFTTSLQELPKEVLAEETETASHRILSKLIFAKHHGYAFIPASFPEKVQFLHKTHPNELTPFVVAGGDFLKTNPEGRLFPGAVILPPVSPSSLLRSPLLRRARDTNFQAVSRQKDSDVIALFFMPDVCMPNADDASAHLSWVIDSMKSLVLGLPSITFVLLCQNRAQQTSATLLQQLVGARPNIQIINLTSEKEIDLSMMYVLSSVDLIFSLKSPTPTVDSLLEVRTEAVLAASAGIPLLSLHERECQPSAICIGDLITKKHLSENDRSSLFWHLINSMPHVNFFSTQINSFSMAAIEKRLQMISSSSLPLSSVEQWLGALEDENIGKKIYSVLSSSC